MLMLVFSTSAFAQLKTQVDNARTTNQIQNNNLRGLSKIYDKQSNAPTPPGDDAQLRRLYELELLKDPATGLIPEGIRERELDFAQRMGERLGKAGATNGRVLEAWKARGPYNVGGRTRALAMDIDNENILLAAGVSGGMWRSEDGGQSWRKTTGSNELQSATAVVQDTRAGFHNVWYYSTGERIGNSASGSGAFFAGNGIYKSIDGGNTWTILPASADNQPQTNVPLDLIFNMAIHPVTGDLYAATWWGIHRTTDGGVTFTEVLSSGRDSWTDVMITPNGAIYATADSFGAPNRGIFRSMDGLAWTNITAANFPAPGASSWGRTVLGYTPSNENIVYAYADNRLSSGAYLWRYTHDDVTPTWVNLSANIPLLGGAVGNLNTQGGYNMVVKVHPSDPNIVFLGATNLYRSTNGFTSTSGTAWIGGYSPANNVSVYPNQHPDHHALLFYPSDPNKAISGNDGGVHFTSDILALNGGTLPVLWTSLNNGYLTTQPYAISLDPKGTGEHLMAGFQDNGSWSTSSNDLLVPWGEEFGGDGSYNAFADGGLTRYVSSQRGNIYRLNYLSADDPAGDYVSFTRVVPVGASGFGFIAPFTLDPNDDNIMYLPAGRTVWRNDNLDGIPIFSNAPTSVNWTNLSNTLVPVGNTISAVAVSRLPANRLYYGTNTGLIFRVDNSNIGDQPSVNISSGKGLPVGNVSCITIDPANADRVFVVYSNYNVLSIFYTEDGGSTWTNISGNLEENPTGIGSGPSVRWLAVEGNSDRYYVGTSTGLYTTTTLAGSSTIWVQEDAGGIGNVVVPMVRTREDGFVAIASHGNGVYSAKFEVTPLPQPKLTVANAIDDFEVFADSPNTIIDISDVFDDADGNPITYSLINIDPALITATLEGNLLTLAYAPGEIGKGTIAIVATAGSETLSEAFSVTVRDLEYVIYNQNTAPFNSRPSQLFTDFGGLLAQSADDFEIPAGQTWTIERVITPGGVNGSPVLNVARVIIYDDNAGSPGNEVYNSGGILPASGTSNPSLELVLPGAVELPAGKYWLTVYVELAFGSGNQWFWSTTSAVTGEEGAFRDVGDLFGTGATDWTPLSLTFGGPPIDMLFTFFGSATGVPTPLAPSELEATSISSNKFNLSWLDNSSDEIGFLIERSTDGSNFSKRTTVGADNIEYADTDLFDPELTYYYRVAAIGLSDTSAYSNIDFTAVIPQAPKAKLATFVFSSFFIANWESTLGAKHYRLDVSSDDFATFLDGYENVKVTGTSYPVRIKRNWYSWRHKNNDEYKYRVRAVNDGGESDNSNVIIVTEIKNLKLSAACSDDPSTTRRWKIYNPNVVDVEVEWFVYKTGERGNVIAPPGDSYVTTEAYNGVNTMIIIWRDDFLRFRLAAKSSRGSTCNAEGYDIAEGRTRADDVGAESESPFIVNSWPNPVTDKFQVLIASPFDEEVDMEIYSVRGERLFATKAMSNTVVEIDATGYPTGIFILKAKQLMYHKTIKLMKR